MHRTFSAGLISTLFLAACSFALASTPRPHAFAQRLVDQLHTAHPEYSEIGISAVIPKAGCKGIASTDKTDIGESCESDDAAPIKSGKESVGTEGKNLDILLPLHDAAGKLIGAIGIETAPGADRAATVSRVRAAVREMEKRIPSKALLIS